MCSRAHVTQTQLSFLLTVSGGSDLCPNFFIFLLSHHLCVYSRPQMVSPLSNWCLDCEQRFPLSTQSSTSALASKGDTEKVFWHLASPSRVYKTSADSVHWLSFISSTVSQTGRLFSLGNSVRFGSITSAYNHNGCLEECQAIHHPFPILPYPGSPLSTLNEHHLSIAPYRRIAAHTLLRNYALSGWLRPVPN